ncbi:MAG: isochorismate synthase [Cyanobacteria bacterium P01_C01_bin.147]
MTVAPSRSNPLSHYTHIYQALKTCLHQARQANSDYLASFSFPLPPIDPLAVLLTYPESHQHQCYFESPSRGQAIAAWEALIGDNFSGGERFATVRQAIAAWQPRLRAFPPRSEGPYFFCSFSFFDTVAAATGGFAPATVRLTRWQIVRQKHRCTLIANLLIRPHSRVGPLARTLVEQVNRLQRFAPSARIPEAGEAPEPSLWQPQLAVSECQQFQQEVQNTLKAIHGEELQKQVVAQAFDVKRSQPFRREIALPRLRSRYPDCYIFSFAGEADSHFIGASPERLLSIRQGRLVTDALAGSAPRGATAEADRALGQQLLRNPKEQQEHQLVLDFIVERLEAAGLNPCYSTPPGLLRLSNIQHLHTPICAEVPPQISPLSLVESLHPTPAVAGVPMSTACARIRQGETCDRGLYAAPLGWIDPAGNSEFVVGIRSALIQRHQARLFAGAGIVADSDPAQELSEIQLKLQALAQALG